MEGGVRRNIALKLKDAAPQRSPSDGVRKKEGERGGGGLRFVTRDGGWEGSDAIWRCEDGMVSERSTGR